MQNLSPRIRTVEDMINTESKTKYLLNMKWDDIGLKQTQFSNTFNVYKPEGESKSALKRTGSKTERASQLFEVLTEEDPRTQLVTEEMHLGPGEA